MINKEKPPFGAVFLHYEPFCPGQEERIAHLVDFVRRGDIFLYAFSENIGKRAAVFKSYIQLIELLKSFV